MSYCLLQADSVAPGADQLDRKSTRLNSSHSQISYAVFCLKKKKTSHSVRSFSSRFAPSPSGVAESHQPLSDLPTVARSMSLPPPVPAAAAILLASLASSAR